ITAGLGGMAALRTTEAEANYRSLGVQPIFLEVGPPYAPSQYDDALAEAARQQAQAVEIWGGADALTHLAVPHRMPPGALHCAMVGAGALLCLEFNQDDRGPRVASIVDKVLRGASPGDISIEQPTRFTLMINIKTANALGITIPQSVVLRADEVIR